MGFASRSDLRLATFIIAGLAASTGSARADGFFGPNRCLILPGSVVVSSSAYDRHQGAVASLTVGTTLPNTAIATTTAISDNNYVTVWNNDSVDGSFGVTSPIRLTDLDPFTGRAFCTIDVPTDQVVTSFSSKSELGLHSFTDWRGTQITFVGYAGAGVGALDVSNSDAVPGQDPTNPVTFAFGNSYAFHRTIVSMDQFGHFAYTPTVDYGGNNGRSTLLSRDGLYYAVGNSNNGNADTFGASNGTNPDVTETTGLEVVNPINGRTVNVTIPPNNSAEVDPLIQYPLGKKGALDKPGKDNNYRGVTEFNGALYFTKGSGSNGMDTVYTVSTLPTLANAASTPITVVPGFPTDSARATGGNFTPFAVFFANPWTMYVTDEGSGFSALDIVRGSCRSACRPPRFSVPARRTIGWIDRKGQAEVGKFHLAVVRPHDVRRLDVAVDQPRGMNRRQSPAGICHYLGRLHPVERSPLVNAVVGAASLHQFHDEIDDALFLIGIVNGHDVGMIEPRRRAPRAGTCERTRAERRFLP